MNICGQTFVLISVRDEILFGYEDDRSGLCPRAPVENGTWSYGRKITAEIKKGERASVEIIISHHHAGIISSSSAPKPCCNCHTDI